MITDRLSLCDQKVMAFYKAIGQTPPPPAKRTQPRPSQQPFVVQGAAAMHPHLTQQMMVQQQIYRLQHQMAAANGSMQNIHPPPSKRPKLAHPAPAAAAPKTKEELRAEKLQRLKLPPRLLGGGKLQQWLEDKLSTIKEFEALWIEVNGRKRSAQQMEQKRAYFSTLRRDIDVMKSTVLQQHTADLQSNEELKRIYRDMTELDRHLPALREQRIRPLVAQFVGQFAGCEVRQTLRAQQDIKRVLRENKFEGMAQRFCNVQGLDTVQDQLFESAANDTLNEDLELLRDFGVQFAVERLKEENPQRFNLQIAFPGHFGSEVDREWVPPSLVVLVDERRYEHFYGMLPQFKGKRADFMDFGFRLKAESGGRFTRNDIEWLDKYKTNTLAANGPFVSIVNVSNFYHDAVKAKMKEMHSKLKQGN